MSFILHVDALSDSGDAFVRHKRFLEVFPYGCRVWLSFGGWLQAHSRLLVAFSTNQSQQLRARRVAFHLESDEQYDYYFFQREEEMVMFKLKWHCQELDENSSSE